MSHNITKCLQTMLGKLGATFSLLFVVLVVLVTAERSDEVGGFRGKGPIAPEARDPFAGMTDQNPEVHELQNPIPSGLEWFESSQGELHEDGVLHDAVHNVKHVAEIGRKVSNKVVAEAAKHLANVEEATTQMDNVQKMSEDLTKKVLAEVTVNDTARMRSLNQAGPADQGGMTPDQDEDNRWPYDPVNVSGNGGVNDSDNVSGHVGLNDMIANQGEAEGASGNKKKNNKDSDQVSALADGFGSAAGSDEDVDEGDGTDEEAAEAEDNESSTKEEGGDSREDGEEDEEENEEEEDSHEETSHGDETSQEDEEENEGEEGSHEDGGEEDSETASESLVDFSNKGRSVPRGKKESRAAIEVRMDRAEKDIVKIISHPDWSDSKEDKQKLNKLRKKIGGFKGLLENMPKDDGRAKDERRAYRSGRKHDRRGKERRNPSWERPSSPRSRDRRLSSPRPREGGPVPRAPFRPGRSDNKELNDVRWGLKRVPSPDRGRKRKDWARPPWAPPPPPPTRAMSSMRSWKMSY